MHMDRITATILIMSVAVGLLGSADAQESSIAQGAGATTGLVISVHTLKDAYEVGEEVALSVTISNANPHAIKLTQTGGIVGTYRPVLKDAEGNTMSFEKAARPERETASRPKAQARSMRLRFQLAPAEVMTYTVSLDQWLKIEHAGTYYLTLLCDREPFSANPVVSNTVKIEVLSKMQKSK